MSLNNLGNSNDCIFLADSYSHISTPFMVMTSAADTNTLLDICALEEPINNNFLQVRNKQDQTLGSLESSQIPKIEVTEVKHDQFSRLEFFFLIN